MCLVGQFVGIEAYVAVDAVHAVACIEPLQRRVVGVHLLNQLLNVMEPCFAQILVSLLVGVKPLTIVVAA